MASAPRPRTRFCPLCATGFTDDRIRCAGGCPVGASCRVLCCPSCGYQFVEDSALVSGAQRFLRWLRRSEA